MKAMPACSGCRAGLAWLIGTEGHLGPQHLLGPGPSPGRSSRQSREAFFIRFFLGKFILVSGISWAKYKLWRWHKLCKPAFLFKI